MKPIRDASYYLVRQIVLQELSSISKVANASKIVESLWLVLPRNHYTIHI